VANLSRFAHALSGLLSKLANDDDTDANFLIYLLLDILTRLLFAYGYFASGPSVYSTWTSSSSSAFPPAARGETISKGFLSYMLSPSSRTNLGYRRWFSRI
jgi:hypothetical protein